MGKTACNTTHLPTAYNARHKSQLRAKKDEAYKALHSLMMRMQGRRANASRVAAEIKEGASIHAIDSCALDVYGIDHRSPDNLYKVPKSELLEYRG